MNFRSLIFGACLLVGALAMFHGWVRGRHSLPPTAGAGIAKAALLVLPPTTTAFITSGVVLDSGTFIDSGPIIDGAQLDDGTFGINRPNVGANSKVSGINGFFTYDPTNPIDSLGFYDPNQPRVWPGVDPSDASAPGDALPIVLIPAPSATNLNNYTAGALCDATANNCGPIFTYNARSLDPNLSSSFAAVAPEPGSIGLIGAGLSALGLLFRRRFVKTEAKV